MRVIRSVQGAKSCNMAKEEAISEKWKPFSDPKSGVPTLEFPKSEGLFRTSGMALPKVEGLFRTSGMVLPKVEGLFRTSGMVLPKVEGLFRTSGMVLPKVEGLFRKWRMVLPKVERKAITIETRLSIASMPVSLMSPLHRVWTSISTSSGAMPPLSTSRLNAVLNVFRS